MKEQILRAIYSVARRADAVDAESLLTSFVSVGGIGMRVSSPDHQIVYGRRGTGKTHTLKYLVASRPPGWLPIYIDMRRIGSNRSIYVDVSLPPEQRATTLLVDFLQAVHQELLGLVLDHEEAFDLSVAGPFLDRLAEAASTTRVMGTRRVETVEQVTSETSSAQSVGAKVSAEPELNASLESGEKKGESVRQTVSDEGKLERYVVFGDVASSLSGVISCAGKHKIALLVDEWSDVPMELQPFLADLIRKTMAASGMVIKIAAIEFNTNFALVRGSQYTGLQVGADIMADINLDDFMVFDTDETRAIEFFRELLYKHYVAAVGEEPPVATDAERFILEVFTEKRAFEEFVRAVEGVPRDAINLLMKAASKAPEGKVTVEIVRAAARDWYRSDKYAFVEQNEEISRLLNWIIDDVIRGRRARAFLFPANSRHPLIERLFDARLLHVLKRNISSKEGGERFDVYKLDYGCYVDLLATANRPVGVLFENEDRIGSEIEVPGDDYRAIRRATLDIEKFENAAGGAKA